jgi:amino-acid N-acetyltransferase
VGRRLVEALEQEAHEAGLHAIFAFTYVPDFFRKVGFQEVERGELPLKVWKDCLRCPKFQCCDEIAVLKTLRPDAVISAGLEPEAALIQLPQVKQNGTRTSPGRR